MNKLLLLSMTAGLLASACTDAADDGQYLFGLSADEVLELRDAYQPEAEDADALAQMQAPFDCDNYGDMCRLLGEDAAYELAEREVEMGLSGASVEDVDAMIDSAMKDVDTADSSRLWATHTGNLSITSAMRVKATYGSVYPIIGTAHSKCYAKYQEKRFNTWSAKKADMLYCRTESHRYWSTVYGSGNIYNGTADYGSQTKRLWGVKALSAKEYHTTPSMGWGFKVKSGVDYNNWIVQTRVRVEVEPKGWSSTRAWEL